MGDKLLSWGRMGKPLPAQSLLFLAPSPSLSTLAVEPVVQVKRVGADGICSTWCVTCVKQVSSLGLDVNAAWPFPHSHHCVWSPTKVYLYLLLKKSWVKCIPSCFDQNLGQQNIKNEDVPPSFGTQTALLDLWGLSKLFDVAEPQHSSSCKVGARRPSRPNCESRKAILSFCSWPPWQDASLLGEREGLPASCLLSQWGTEARGALHREREPSVEQV